MKIAVTGKGGVGKTTFSALLCNYYESAGTKILAVDADPDANLAATLGFPADVHPAPIASLTELIHERTGAKPGTFSGFFNLNPKVDDIPDRYCLRRGFLSLIALGVVEKGGGGCMCPGSSFLKALMAHLVFEEGRHLIMDMEAGLEHLGRGTATAVDALIVVVRPDSKSLETAHRIVPLWKHLGKADLFFVGNESESPEDEAFLRSTLTDFPLLGVIPASNEVRKSGRENRTPFGDPAVNEAVAAIVESLEKAVGKGKV